MANKLVELISTQTAKYGDREALSYKDNSTKQWIKKSWNDFKSEIDSIALALEILGIKENDNIGIFSQNCPHILVTYFAAFNNRVVPAPIYATSSCDEVAYILNDASIEYLFVGGQTQYDVAREAMTNAKSLKVIIAFNDNIIFADDDKTSLNWDSLLKLGMCATENCKNEVARRREAGKPEDLACLIYTSGTTGVPKGVMLSHSNFDAAMRIHLERLTMTNDTDRSLSFLPMSHIFELAWSMYCFTAGITIAVNSNPKKIQDALKEVRPTIMCSVPRFWEKVYVGINENVAKMGKLQQFLVKRAMKVGAKYNLNYKRVDKKAPWLLEKQYNLFDKIILSKMRKAVGVENGNIFPTAGAPISANIVEFLHTIGINIVVGYGLSETCATVTCFPERDFTIGTTGTVLPDISVKIGENNEVLVKAPTIMQGYYKKPKETAEAFTADGYFRTGDAGKIAEDGALILTERLKDLFKTSNGKYIAPQALESRLGEDKFIEQVAVIGDQRKYVTAIIIPAYEALKEYAQKKKIEYQNVEELVKNADVCQMIAERIDAIQKNLASFEQIKKFTLLPKAFSMETGELTNTLKIRRPKINELYSREIEAMYA